MMCFTDGKTIVPMVPSQDHKRAYDNDEGLIPAVWASLLPRQI